MASDPYNLRNLSDRELFKWIGGWKQGWVEAGHRKTRSGNRRTEAPELGPG